ncbi:hypothetical protein [Virgibacillus dokdonensis]|uniref:hypothetical protein n=1 Tax=Virgibacillus dokdonensis TaxID=302167 RepID=UPI001C376EBA|nr:hypothetical protein [Virgibacillus dokdonensis]
MGNVQGFSRDQISFQLLSLDEMIDKENPVRELMLSSNHSAWSIWELKNIKNIILDNNRMREKIY